MAGNMAELVCLGVAQDSGWPHIGCDKQCCTNRQGGVVAPGARVSCLGVVDHQSKEAFLLDATPDIASQLYDLLTPTFSTSHAESSASETLLRATPAESKQEALSLAGVFLTHAHIGHYLGLAFLGREGLSSKALPVYAMPLMKTFLETNAPWKQLVALKNISVRPLQADRPETEFSETVGYQISGESKSALFVPDIDTWEQWEAQSGVSLQSRVEEHDYCFFDGTFFSLKELQGHRDPTEIPHPPVSHTIDKLKNLPAALKRRVYFIHLNHTNDLLRDGTEARRQVKLAGFQVVTDGQHFHL